VRIFGFDREPVYPGTARAHTLRMGDADGLEADLESEIHDIEVRYRHAADDAAFSLQALENGGGGGSTGRFNIVSRAVEQCSRCCARLQQQLALLRELRQQLDAFVIGRRR
jgi:hypothetical protein